MTFESHEVVYFRFNNNGNLFLFEYSDTIKLLNLDNEKIFTIKDNLKQIENSYLSNLERYGSPFLFTKNDKHIALVDYANFNDEEEKSKLTLINPTNGKVEFTEYYRTNDAVDNYFIKEKINKLEKNNNGCMVM
jgi:hypothetical protein